MTPNDASAPWTLVIRRGRTSDLCRPVCGRMTLGTSSHCDVRFTHGVAPVHAIVEAVGPGVRVTALHAEPWTIVDGVPIQTAVVRPGQSLSIHGIELAVVAATAADRSVGMLPKPGGVDVPQEARDVSLSAGRERDGGLRPTCRTRQRVPMASVISAAVARHDRETEDRPTPGVLRRAA